MAKPRNPNGSYKSGLETHVEGEGAGAMIKDFRASLVHVEALATFLNSDTGIEVRKLIVACSPLNLLASAPDAFDPVRLRILPKVEGESSDVLMARELGWRSLSRLLVETLTNEVLPQRSARAELTRKWETEEDK